MCKGVRDVFLSRKIKEQEGGNKEEDECLWNKEGEQNKRKVG